MALFGRGPSALHVARGWSGERPGGGRAHALEAATRCRRVVEAWLGAGPQCPACLVPVVQTGLLRGGRVKASGHGGAWQATAQPSPDVTEPGDPKGAGSRGGRARTAQGRVVRSTFPRRRSGRRTRQGEVEPSHRTPPRADWGRGQVHRPKPSSPWGASAREARPADLPTI